MKNLIKKLIRYHAMRSFHIQNVPYFSCETRLAHFTSKNKKIDIPYKNKP